MSADIYDHLPGMDNEVFRFILLHLPNLVDGLLVEGVDPDPHPGGVIDVLDDRALTRVPPIE